MNNISRIRKFIVGLIVVVISCIGISLIYGVFTHRSEIKQEQVENKRLDNMGIDSKKRKKMLEETKTTDDYSVAIGTLSRSTVYKDDKNTIVTKDIHKIDFEHIKDGLYLVYYPQTEKGDLVKKVAKSYLKEDGGYPLYVVYGSLESEINTFNIIYTKLHGKHRVETMDVLGVFIKDGKIEKEYMNGNKLNKLPREY